MAKNIIKYYVDKIWRKPVNDWQGLRSHLHKLTGRCHSSGIQSSSQCDLSVLDFLLQKLQFLVSREDFYILIKNKPENRILCRSASVPLISLNIQYYETGPYAAAGGIHDIAYKSPERCSEWDERCIYIYV